MRRNALPQATITGVLIFAAGIRISSLIGLGLIGTHMCVWASMGLMNATIPIALALQLWRSPLLVPTAPAAAEEVAPAEAVGSAGTH